MAKKVSIKYDKDIALKLIDIIVQRFDYLKNNKYNLHFDFDYDNDKMIIIFNDNEEE